MQFTFDTPGNSKGVRDGGKVIGLAVTGTKRSVAAPDVPTFKELGYEGFDDLHVANGLLAPKGTSPKMIAAFAAEIVKLNQSGTIHDRLVAASYVPGVLSPRAYGEMIDRELDAMGQDRPRHRGADQELVRCHSGAPRSGEPGMTPG